jgi:hypothetical protein
MEVRAMPARFPTIASADAGRLPPLPAVEQGADFPALQVVREYLSHVPLREGPQPVTLRGIIRRNAIQDMALAALMDPTLAGTDALQRRVIDLLGNNFRSVPHVFGAEWYLRLRDYLYNQYTSH